MTMSIRFVRIILGAAGALLLTRPGLSQEEARFKDTAHLYDTYCAQCHGISRNGKGVNTVGLAVQPKDHSDTQAMASIPREQMVRAIRDGGAAVNKSPLMPPWSSVLTDEQVEQMVDYLIHVCKCDKPQ